MLALDWSQILIGLGVALLVAWIALAVALLALRPQDQSLRDLAKVVPQTLRLVTALYRDRALPRSVRWRLRVALIYNVQPINLIPDFIPVIGFADNAIVLIWALRSTVRVAGTDAVEGHWTGTPEGLGVIYRAMRIQPSNREVP
jgi:uncharacterized membrane protein YkvA (DUF1232 family)